MRNSELLEKKECYLIESGQLEGGDYVKVPPAIHWRLLFSKLLLKVKLLVMGEENHNDCYSHF